MRFKQNPEIEAVDILLQEKIARKYDNYKRRKREN